MYLLGVRQLNNTFPICLFPTNKEFWKTIKPFLTNKGCLENSDIMLINDMINDDKTLAKTFNKNYSNTVERSSGLKPEKMEFENSLNNNRNILHSITDHYKNYPSILKIKSEVFPKFCSVVIYLVIFQ